MALCLVMHDLPPGAAQALEDAVWELSESHWSIAGGMLVVTDLSAGYLHSHFQRALRRAGTAGQLVVSRVTGELHMSGLDPEAVAWVQRALQSAAE